MCFILYYEGVTSESDGPGSYSLALFLWKIAFQVFRQIDNLFIIIRNESELSCHSHSHNLYVCKPFTLENVCILDILQSLNSRVVLISSISGIDKLRRRRRGGIHRSHGWLEPCPPNASKQGCKAALSGPGYYDYPWALSWELYDCNIQLSWLRV